jgi:N-acetylmuramoyl-L-alanine amidase CwlA
MTYQITHDYIKHGNARPGDPLRGPLFGVAHDIGDGGSTAHQNRLYFNNHQPPASAHVFIDDKVILVIIPLKEKAYHVQYQKPMDNLLFGDDANDAAIGVELCWGGKINFQEAYKRYVWFWAWLCKKYNWDPHKHIVSHKKLDPQRRTDPDNALNKYGITFEQFLDDVKKEILPKQVIKEAVKKMERDANYLPNDEKIEEEWKEAQANGYFDGTRPNDLMPRYEAAIVVNRLRRNFKEFVFKPMEKRLIELEKEVAALKGGQK